MNDFASPFGFILRILKHFRYTHSWEKCLLRKLVLCVWNAALQGAEYFYYFGTQSSAAEFGLWAVQFSSEDCFNWVNRVILKDSKFAGSGIPARLVHLFIATPAQEVSSRLLVQLSWLEIPDPPQQFFPKKSPVKLLAFWLNVKEAGEIQTS